jgi:hypothetical protein
MKSQTISVKGSLRAWSPDILSIKTLIMSALILTGIQTALKGQDERFSKPSLWFGGALGANTNFYRGSTQKLNPDLTIPTAFHNGSGVGLYLAPLIEFHIPDSKFGAMLQVGYDSRRGSFKQVITPCNCPADLSVRVSYLTIEPSLRFAPFNSGLYFYGGPRLAFNIAKSKP